MKSRKNTKVDVKSYGKIFGRADLSNEIHVKLIQETYLNAKLWQDVSAIKEDEHTAIKLSKAIAATKIEYYNYFT